MSSPKVDAQTLLPTHFNNTLSGITPEPEATDQPDPVWRWRAGLVAKIDIVNHFILILRTALYLWVVDYSCINLPCTLPGPSSLDWFYLHERGKIIPPVLLFTLVANYDEYETRKSRFESSDAIKWYIIPFLIYSAFFITLSAFLWKASVSPGEEDTRDCLIVATFWLENIGVVVLCEILFDCYVLYTLASGTNPANPFVEILSILVFWTYMGGSIFVVYRFWQELRLRHNILDMMGMRLHPLALRQPSVVRTQPAETSNPNSPQPFGMEEYGAVAYPRQQEVFQTLNSSTPPQQF